jgi:mono/diheme cytochrome c family protein
MKALLVVPLLAAVAATAIPTVANATDVTSMTGQQVFLRFCASCHGGDGRGAGPAAAALRTPPPDLTQLAVRYGGSFPDDWIYQSIDGRVFVGAHGTREMPVWGVELWRVQGAEVAAGLKTEAVIDRLVDWLRSIQQPPPANGGGGGRP